MTAEKRGARAGKGTDAGVQGRNTTPLDHSAPISEVESDVARGDRAARPPKREVDVFQLQSEVAALELQLEAKRATLALYEANPQCAFADAQPEFGGRGLDHLLVHDLGSASGCGCGFDIRLRVGSVDEGCGLNQGQEVQLHIQGSSEVGQLQRYLAYLAQILDYKEVRRG